MRISDWSSDVCSSDLSLDRGRLDTFLRHIHRLEGSGPDRIATISPVLTQSLSVKLKTACLDQPADLQAACLTQDREALLLADTHTSELAETLAGAPTALAYRISATRQAGNGSSKIGREPGRGDEWQDV